MAKEKEEVYFLNRDKEESARLNEQYVFLTDVVGGSPIHPSIPKDNLFAVADIATGTGVWVKHVSELLAREAPSDRSRYYHGFDISPDQFPSNAGDLHFSVQDVLEPFPSEHLNRYDLVHVSLLVGGIKLKDYNTVVANLAALLKPGGYIQWAEPAMDAFSQTKKDEYPRFSEIIKYMHDAGEELGYSTNAPATVYKVSKATGLVDVTRHDYSTIAQPRLYEGTQQWILKALRAVVPVMVLRSGEVADKEGASKESDRIFKELKDDFAAGVVPDATIGIVVGRKPE